MTTLTQSSILVYNVGFYKCNWCQMLQNSQQTFYSQICVRYIHTGNHKTQNGMSNIEEFHTIVVGSVFYCNDYFAEFVTAFQCLLRFSYLYYCNTMVWVVSNNEN